MNYAIFDENGQFYDLINFDSNETLNEFKKLNPTLVCIKEEEFSQTDSLSIDDEVDLSDIDLDEIL